MKDQASRSKALMAGPSNPSIYNQTTTTASVTQTSQALTKTQREKHTEKLKQTIVNTVASGMDYSTA